MFTPRFTRTTIATPQEIHHQTAQNVGGISYSANPPVEKRLFDQMMVNAQGSGPKCAALMENIVSKSGLKFMCDDQSLLVTLSRDHESCGEGPSYGPLNYGVYVVT